MEPFSCFLLFEIMKKIVTIKVFIIYGKLNWDGIEIGILKNIR